MLRGGRAARRRLARRWFFDLASRITPALEAEWESGRYLVPTRGGSIGRTTFADGPYELDQGTLALDALRRLARPHFDLSNKVVIEVGANIGTVTVPLVTVHGARKVVAVEAAPANFRFLLANIALNSLSERVLAVQAAASDVDREVELEVAANQWGDYRVRPDSYSTRDEFAETTRAIASVSATRIDSLLSALGVDPDDVGLLWVDAQGHEAHVLAGATELLQRHVPVVLEYWPYGLEAVNSVARLEDLIASHYSSYVDTSELAPSRRGSGHDGALTIHETSSISELRARYPQYENGSFVNRFTNLLLWNDPTRRDA